MENLDKTSPVADDNKIANQKNEINNVNVSPQQSPGKMSVPDETNKQGKDNNQDLAALLTDDQKFCMHEFEKEETLTKTMKQEIEEPYYEYNYLLSTETLLSSPLQWPEEYNRN